MNKLLKTIDSIDAIDPIRKSSLENDCTPAGIWMNRSALIYGLDRLLEDRQVKRQLCEIAKSNQRQTFLPNFELLADCFWMRKCRKYQY